MQIVDFAVLAVALDYFFKFIRVGIKDVSGNWENNLIYRWQCLFLNLKQLAFCLKAEAFALYFAVRDSAISKYANFLIAAIVAYAFSLIDLIPDLF